ncbi:Cro/CI family transcriptional regulator [Pseudomonas amygdali pv. aesculi str. 0893_23]|uniref:Cro/CI family transcriptional regulator n=2 Tax=Pseudomonas syringae group TaxID=136849 RepID=A0A0P9W731_9PSED|nr:Cro/CI family transcriptional regulator [Pseudomonas amygdali pv. aesculi str. 0893_23]KPW26406.1 Cro/CI family transcriptional regulator [Pseudomonas amygdali pv. aesculi]KPX00059.1 Cro/CI family transcriptional regulator [Pseudomonas syringae pv. castaneae]KPX78958.1 Cro/CI family transcriptional regulator [Pseudomonas meliae]
MLTLLLGLAVDLDPGVKAVHGHAQALGDIGHRFAFFGHLLDRFDLEFFGVTLTTHGTSYLGLIMRLGGVYETRGDSVVARAKWMTELARETGLSREQLYRSFSSKGNPTLKTMLTVMRALDMTARMH